MTTPEGVLIGSVSKVVQGTAFPWAFAMTGNLLPEAILTTALTDPARTADAAAFSRALPDALRQMVEQTAFKLRIPMAAIMTQAVGVMWDEAEQRLVGFFVTTHSGALRRCSAAWSTPLGPRCCWRIMHWCPRIRGAQCTSSRTASKTHSTDWTRLSARLRRRRCRRDPLVIVGVDPRLQGGGRHSVDLG
ncbi:hypothetical protein NZL82_15555 [Sphingomonas sanguinis]|nr:hypothetical protein [Sphingomonas sp. LC-1]